LTKERKKIVGGPVACAKIFKREGVKVMSQVEFEMTSQIDLNNDVTILHAQVISFTKQISANLRASCHKNDKSLNL